MRYFFTLSLFCCFSFVSAQAFNSSTLPLIVIDTEEEEIPDEPKIMARMGIIDNGPGELNRLTDPYNDYDGWIGIERRGSSSQSFPKLGYGIETRTEDEEDLDVSLLGFPEEEDWVLHGPFSDKSLIRNALLYSLAGEMMPYAPRIRMVEVFLNDDYRGVYLFTEKIKRDGDRVDIAKLEEDENDGDDLTGGYILKLDKGTGETGDDPFFFTSDFTADTENEQAINYYYHYPKPSDITSEQRTYIQEWIKH